MLTVAIIDDREDLRTRLKKLVRRHLDDNGVQWEIEGFAPLQNIEDYPNWIAENKIVLLIVDEKLREEPNDGALVNYNGHELINIVRKRNKQLPIYVITSHAENEALDEHMAEFEDVVARDTFHENTSKFIKRFIRATQSYLDNYQNEYARLAELSEKSALDKASEEEIKELKALQVKLQIPLSSYIIDDRINWIREIEESTKELDQLYEDCKKHLEE
jgi:DNA-binding NarL/FixJ family response regulator